MELRPYRSLGLVGQSETGPLPGLGGLTRLEIDGGRIWNRYVMVRRAELGDSENRVGPIDFAQSELRPPPRRQVTDALRARLGGLSVL